MELQKSLIEDFLKIFSRSRGITTTLIQGLVDRYLRLLNVPIWHPAKVALTPNVTKDIVELCVQVAPPITICDLTPA